MTTDLSDLMNLAAIRAAEVILAVYRTPFEARRKGDGSPVTEADQRAEAIIIETLMPTGIPVLAEESGKSPRRSRR